MVKCFKRLLQLLRITFVLKKVRRAESGDQRLLARKALATLFADTRGMAMKIGQILIEGDDDPMRILHTSISPLSIKKIKPFIELELGQSLISVFRSIEESTAAASLGQVHFAELHNGEQIAVKVRYPEIVDAVEAELGLAGLLPGVGPVKQWGFDLNAYKQVLADNMHRELDYLSEAQRQQYFFDTVQVTGLLVPKVYMQWCRSGILVQSRARGEQIEVASHWSEKDRLVLAETLLTTFFKSLFVAGLVHGDPHPGNAFFSHNESGEPVISLLDYGCMIEISEQRRLALLQLIIGCHELNDCQPLNCFSALGFDAYKLSYINASLPALCQILFKPFLENRPFILTNWQVKKDITALLADDRWWFRSAGPADLFLLMRAFQGLVQQLTMLNVNVSWWRILQQSVGNHLMQQARNYSLVDVSVSLNIKSMAFNALANTLHVQVYEAGLEKVSVTLPASAVLELKQLMPEDVLLLLEQSKTIDLDHTLEHIRQTGIKAQKVFDFQQDNKTYCVWLE